MIVIENLKKNIGETEILHDITFTVKDGEILGFLGPNGAGKSTTMKILTGFWTPTAGKVTINGLDVQADALQIKQKIGYLPETVPLYDDMRVYEYLRWIAEVRGIEPNNIITRIKTTAEACGLQKVIKKSIEELSKGFRQRVGLAQAIIHEPEILILDEPTTGLDPNQIVEIRNLIKHIGRDKTVIFSTHILSEVQATCDRVIIINNGNIVGQGTAQELTQQAGSREIIYVKIKGPREQVFTMLKNFPDIEDIIEKDRETDDIFGYEIKPVLGIDVREQLSKTVMRNNWSILEFNRKLMQMEDVFRELTK